MKALSRAQRTPSRLRRISVAGCATAIAAAASLVPAGDAAASPATAPSSATAQATPDGSELATQISIPGHADLLAIEDISGDAIADLVVGGTDPTVPSSVGGVIRMYLGRREGPPRLVGTYTGLHLPEAIDIGDVTGDGRPDVVMGERWDEALQVLAQRPDGSLAPPVTYLTETWPNLQIGDVTGDGRLDVVSLAWEDVLEVREQTETGQLGAPAQYPVSVQGFNDLELADVTGDGRLDVVALSGQGLGPETFVLRQAADGTLAPATTYADPEEPDGCGLGVGDVTGDGKADVLVAGGGNSTGNLRVFEVGQDGSLAEPMTLPSYDIPCATGAADMDGDGDMDAVVIHVGWERVGVYHQLASGGLSSEVLAPSAYVSWGVQRLDLGDLDGNGTTDVALALGFTGIELHLNGRAAAPQPAPTAVAADGQATVSWTPPASDGGSPVTGYLVTPFIGFFPLVPRSFGPDATQQVVTGLTNGTQYRFRVQAVNDNGPGLPSKTSNAIVPQGPPTAPNMLRNATASASSATVSWTAPTSDGGSPVTGYVVTPFVGYFPLSPIAFDSAVTSQVVTGLTPGWTYRFKVAATNSAGTGPMSKVSNPVTPT